MSNKTVYILGAGASKSASLPIQNELLTTLFSIEPPTTTDYELFSPNRDNVSIELEEYLEQYSKYFIIARFNIAKFIVHTFGSSIIENTLCHINETDLENNSKNDYQATLLKTFYKQITLLNINIEDVFTLLDNLESTKNNFKSYNSEELKKMHTDLKFCIIYTLTYCICKNKDNKKTYTDFAKYLINLKRDSNQSDDSFSVISLNWDNLMESELQRLCDFYNETETDTHQKLLLDYCLYDYSYETDLNHIHSTQIKARGYKNIKFLNLHGSINWLVCPICNRILIDSYKTISLKSYSHPLCPYCSKSSNNEYKADLQSLFITPTFLKSLDNIHIKNLWNNAYIELSEASKVVFIGYSFPNADFEIRCLLKKALHNKTKIDVILHQSDDPNFYLNTLNNSLSMQECGRIMSKIELPENRYKSFFGNHECTFNYNGFETYIHSIMGDK